jgi:transposase
VSKGEFSRKIVCTQTIVDTMLKESEISRCLPRRSHRTYTPEFKAELVAACQQPGVSIAALAGQHAMNANVLHLWRKEHQRSGCHRLAAQRAPHTPGLAAFLPVALSAPTSTPTPAGHDNGNGQEIRMELRKGALTMVVTWPVCAAADFASWIAALLK